MKFLYKPLIILGVLLVFGVANARIYNPPAWLNNWDNRVRITTNNSQVAGNLTNYPAYFDFNGLPSNFWAAVQSNGIDVRLTSSDAITVLNHELVAIDTSAETGEVHFDTVLISSTTDTIFYLYYNNSNAGDISTTATWNSNYITVLHLKDDPDTSTVQDSTSNNNDGTKFSANNPIEIDAQIGKGQDFSSDYITLPDNILASSAAWSLGTWINADTLGAGNRTFFQLHQDFNIQLLYQGDVTSFRLQTFDGSTAVNSDTETVSTATWYYVVGTYDGTTQRIYLNGSLADSDLINTPSSTSVASRLGAHRTGNDFWDGIMDEARLSNVARSADWISTEYNNQSSSTAFWVIGIEENAPANFLNGGGFNF